MKMIGEIVVESLEVISDTIKGRQGEFVVRSQSGMCKLGKEIRCIRIKLNGDQAPYSVGKYACETVMTVNNFGDFLVPRVLSLRALKG